MATQNQDRLRAHFAASDPSKHPDLWDGLWKDGTFIPWDRGFANPALIDLLTCNPPPLSSSTNPSPGAPNSPFIENLALPKPLRQDGSRARVLVPGCGKGYDVALFAAHGYDAFGLEVAASAIDVAREYLRNPGEGPLEGEYNVRGNGVGRGKMEVVLGDYFKDDWLKELDDGKVEFDIIYDITFLCALPPQLRPKWASRTASLLSPIGTLVCLEFPTHKSPSSGGPPWSLPATVYIELLKRPGEDIQYDDDGTVIETGRPEAGNALVRFAHYNPKRTHKVSIINDVVRDSVSLWRHAS